jgi:hypothetical protein
MAVSKTIDATCQQDVVVVAYSHRCHSFDGHHLDLVRLVAARKIKASSVKGRHILVADGHRPTT